MANISAVRPANHMRAAYITDMHLSPGSTQIRALTNKMSELRSKGISAFFLGGDLLPMAKHHWPILENGLEKGSDGTAQKAEMTAYIKALGDEVLPQIEEAAGGNPMFFCHGNADYLGYEYIKQAFPVFKLTDASGPLSFNGFNVVGTGGVPAEKENSALRPYAENSPWFRGNIKAEEYLELLETMRSSIGLNTILMTHIPAYGHVDIYKGQHQGYIPLEQLINKKSPLLHLTGHVHDAPLYGDAYYFSKTFSMIGGGTLSVNPGGGFRHDDGAGIRGALIDLTGLKEMRDKGILTQETAAEVIEAV